MTTIVYHSTVVRLSLAHGDHMAAPGLRERSISADLLMWSTSATILRVAATMDVVSLRYLL